MHNAERETSKGLGEGTRMFRARQNETGGGGFERAIELFYHFYLAT